MPKISVRTALPEDVPALVRFNAAMAGETEGKSLELEVLEKGIRAVFADCAKGFYLLAEIDGRPAGSLLVTREWSDWRNGWYFWVQSVYVEAAQRRKGVYTALHRRVEELARKAGDVRGIRLYVDERNQGAKSTYEKLGMKRSRYDLFESGAPAPAKPRPNG